jgi:O-antigen ligase
MSYLDLLFQTGLFGFMAYVAGVVWIYWKGTTIIKEGGALGQVMLPALVGMSCFLIASMTNPYLTKFDGLWAIFLPVALINFWLVRRSIKPLAASHTVSQFV